jgi:uncharacterized protein (DUF427 family)
VPNRFYVPRDDVRAPLAPSEQTYVCPYKGEGTYWSVDGLDDVAWSFDEPLDGVRRLTGHVSFDTTKVEVRVDDD